MAKKIQVLKAEEVKPNMFIPTYSDVIMLNAALERLKNENLVGHNMSFKTANIINRQAILPYVQAVDSAKQQPSGYAEYQSKLNELKMKHALKDENGDILFFASDANGELVKTGRDNPNAIAKWSDPKAFTEEHDLLKIQYGNVIKQVEEIPKVVSALLASQVEGFPNLKKVEPPYNPELPESILEPLFLFGIITLQ